MTLGEKAAYVKGIIEGLDFQKDSKEYKIWANITDLLCDISESISSVEQNVDELFDEVSDLDEGLSNVEEVVFPQDGDNCNCEADFVKIKCPNCDNKISISKNAVDKNQEIECPICGEKFELDFNCLCECDCDDCRCDEDEN